MAKFIGIEIGGKTEVDIKSASGILEEGVKYYTIAKETGDKENFIKAKRFFLEAKEEGNTRAYHLLGKVFYRLGEVENNLKYLREGVQKGDRKSFYYLAKVYHLGEIVKKDIQEAEKYYKKAIELGVEGAIESLYLMYKNDETKLISIVDWYSELGRKLKNGQMMYNSALFYIDDENGISQDRQTALRYFQAGMSFECSQSKLEIAKMYMEDSIRILESIHDEIPDKVDDLKKYIIGKMQ